MGQFAPSPTFLMGLCDTSRGMTGPRRGSWRWEAGLGSSPVWSRRMKATCPFSQWKQYKKLLEGGIWGRCWLPSPLESVSCQSWERAEIMEQTGCVEPGPAQWDGADGQHRPARLREAALPSPRVLVLISLVSEVFHRRAGKHRKRKAHLSQSGPTGPRKRKTCDLGSLPRPRRVFRPSREAEGKLGVKLRPWHRPHLAFLASHSSGPPLLRPPPEPVPHAQATVGLQPQLCATLHLT